MDENSTPPVGMDDIEVQLRWSDQDKLAHVNNASIITLMEEARVRWSGRDRTSTLFPHGLVVASLQVDYLKPLYYEPSIKVRVGVSRIGNKSFSLRHIGYQKGHAVFDGTNVMVALAEDGVASRPLSDQERRWLARRELQAADTHRR